MFASCPLTHSCFACDLSTYPRTDVCWYSQCTWTQPEGQYVRGCSFCLNLWILSIIIEISEWSLYDSSVSCERYIEFTFWIFSGLLDGNLL